ncbi:bifunctional hydroxymethylpyrimidine kinase/phosphomethylpyrimidine kinase [Antarctobacter jejuensis]|uniref:bifunctional hydroxymethylpyrimidine kinase/phosphomethylpyrimidine kinase n=1 Tax=Antarctobacter jejuensis TaxID=1439938 RepID=UPI003FD025AE
MIPNILSIAGSDSSGGAGIQADIKAISANGGYAMTAITALTAQNTQGVTAVHLCPVEILTAQIAAIRTDVRIGAIKIGMLGDAAITRCVANALTGLTCPVVLDPVMVAKGGDRLLAEDAIAALRETLFPMAALITPNLPEAADLLGRTEARNRDEMRDQARALLALGPQAVLLKGGHLAGADCPDVLITPEAEHWLSAPRIDTRNTHGTGCTLSSAIAARLGQGLPLLPALTGAKSYITAAIRAADQLEVGRGHGPVHHFHALKETTQ